MLILFAAATVTDALMRSFAGGSLDVVRDTGSLVVALAGACCLPIVIVERGNIMLRVLDHRSLKPVGKLADVLASVLVSSILLAMAQQFTKFAANSAAAGEATWLLMVPYAPFYYAITAILWFCLFCQLVLLASDIRAIFSTSEVTP